MKKKQTKHFGVLLLILVLSLALPGCRSMGDLLKDAILDSTETTTSTENIDDLLQTDGKIDVLTGGDQNLIDYADKVVQETGLNANWDSLAFAFQNKKCDWIGKKLSEVEADTELNLYVLNEATTLGPGMQQDVGLSTEEYVNSGGTYKRFIFSMTVANPDPKETIPLEDAKVIAVALNNMMAFPGEVPTDGSAWVLPQGVMLGGSLERVRELYGEPDYTWGNDAGLQNCIAYLKDGKSLTIWASEFPFGQMKGKTMIEAVLLRDLTEPDYITKGSGHSEFAADLSGEPYLNVAGYKVYMNAPFKDAMESLHLIPLDSDTTRETIPARTAVNYTCRLAGYGNNIAGFHVLNMTDAEIPIEDGTIIGFQIKQYDTVLDPVESRISQVPEPEYLDPGDPAKGLPYTAPVYGPYGIASGDSQEDFLAKAPADATVKNPYDSGDQKSMEVETADYYYRVATDGGRYHDLADDEYYVTEFMLKTTGW